MLRIHPDPRDDKIKRRVFTDPNAADAAGERTSILKKRPHPGHGAGITGPERNHETDSVSKGAPRGGQGSPIDGIDGAVHWR